MRSRDQAETAEAVEGRELAKGKTGEHTRVRTQCRSARQRALDRIRQAARRDRAKPLTALWHHVYDVNRLREAYYGLNRKAAPGVDGQTWAAYGEHLEVNLRDLSERLKRGAYHARPVERVSIPKPDGRQRPIGIPMCPAYCTSYQWALGMAVACLWWGSQRRRRLPQYTPGSCGWQTPRLALPAGLAQRGDHP